jgi:hypothetical protein
MSQPQNGPQYPPAGQYQPAPAPAPKKKTKKWPWIVGGIVALIVIGGVANGGKDSAPAAGGTTTAAAQPTAVQPAAPVEKKPAMHTVVYEVTGAGTANNITYTTDGMTSTEQVSNAALPWSKTIELKTGQAIQMVSVMAQAGAGTPEISVKITVDGKVIKEGKSSGQYAVVNVNENIGSFK